MIIVCDTREKENSAYSFPKYEVKRKKLDSGDYSILGMESRISLEKKELPDIYNCCGNDRKRFVSELTRLSLFEYAAIIIESTMSDFILYPEAFNKKLLKRCKRNLTLDYKTLKMKMSPKAAINSLFAWSIRYDVHVFWCGSREYGQATALRLLEKFYKYKGEKNKNA